MARVTKADFELSDEEEFLNNDESFDPVGNDDDATYVYFNENKKNKIIIDSSIIKPTHKSVIYNRLTHNDPIGVSFTTYFENTLTEYVPNSGLYDYVTSLYNKNIQYKQNNELDNVRTMFELFYDFKDVKDEKYNKLYSNVHPYFDIDGLIKENNDPLPEEIFNELEKISETYGRYSVIGYINKDYNIEQNIPSDIWGSIRIAQNTPYNETQTNKKYKNGLFYLEVRPNAAKNISLHICFYEAYVKYGDFIAGGRKFVLKSYPALDKCIDKSVYSRFQKFRNILFDKVTVKNKKTEVKERGLLFIDTVQDKQLILSSFVSYVDPVADKHFDKFIFESTDDIEDEPAIYDDVKKLLNALCVFKGYDTVYKEMFKYIPNNEREMFETEIFNDCYTILYNKIPHKSFDEELSRMEACHFGVLHCLANIHKDIIKKYKPDKREKDIDVINKYRALVRSYTNVREYCFKRYRYDLSKSSANKINQKIDNGAMLSLEYKHMYLRKIVFAYEDNLILKISDSNIKIYKNTDRKIVPCLHTALRISKLGDNWISQLKLFTSINDPAGKNNYNLYNFNYFAEELTITEDENIDYERFLKIMFNDSFVTKESGNIALNIFISDIKSKFQNNNNIVKLYVGEGGNLKTSEYLLYKNIINNINYCGDIEINNYLKPQKREVLKNLYLCVEEVPKDGKTFRAFIDEVKHYSENSTVLVRGMCENESAQRINIRHQINTNNIGLISSFIKRMNSAEKRRFLIATRHVDNKEDLTWCAGKARDKEFCMKLAKYVYQIKQQTIDFDKNKSFLEEYNNNNKEFDTVVHAEDNEYIESLTGLYVVSIVTLSKNDTQTYYKVNVRDWLKKYNELYRLPNNKKNIALNDFVETIKRFVDEKSVYYEGGKQKRKGFVLNNETARKYEELIKDINSDNDVTMEE